MEDKNFDKEKTAGQEHAPAGHNRRRRRRKKSGSAHHVQQPAARPEAEKTAVTPEASGSEPEKEKTEPVTEQTTEAPAVPESPEPAESPDAAPEPAETPQEADQPEPPEEAEPAAEEAAQLPETAEKDAGTTISSQEQTPESPETPEEPAEGEEDEEPETPEQARRAAEMTRTVQLSIEKIVENIEREESEPEEGEPAEDAETVPLTRLQQLHQRVGDSLWSLLKWMIFVVAFVAVVAGAGIAWLYKGATPDAIPQVSASFNGQDLQATSYSWHVPVVANVFKRTYAKTVSKEPTQIAATIETAQVDLSVRHTDCDTRLTVEDSDGESVFEGTAEEFGNYTFTKNDTYTAELVIFRNEEIPRFYRNYSIKTRPSSYFFPHSIKVTNHIILHSPTIKSIIDSRRSNHP